MIFIPNHRRLHNQYIKMDWHVLFYFINSFTFKSPSYEYFLRVKHFYKTLSSTHTCFLSRRILPWVNEVVTYFAESTRLQCVIRKNDDKTRTIVILTCVYLLSALQHKIMIWSYDFILLNYKHIQNIKWAHPPRRRLGVCALSLTSIHKCSDTTA